MTSLGDPARSVYSNDSIGDDLVVTWREGVDPGLAVPLQVHGPVLLATTAGRAVVAMSAESGLRYWSRRYAGPIAGSALRRNDTIFLATGDREKRMYAIDIRRGRGQWSSRIGDVRLEPLLLDSSIIAVTETGDVIALATADGHRRWMTSLAMAPAIPPTIANGHIEVATIRDTLYGIDPAGGAITDRLALPASPSAPATAWNDLLVIPAGRAVLGVTVGATPAIRWSAAVPDPVDASPVRIADAVFVLDRSAHVWRITAGGAISRIADLGGAASGSLTAVGNRLVVGTLDGRLILLSPQGDVTATLDLEDSIIAPVAAGDNVLWVPLMRGTIVRIEG